MPKDITRADYEQLKQIAARFERESQSSQNMQQSLRSLVEQLRGGDWIGQGATAFYAEMESAVLPSLGRLVKALHSAASATQKISAEVKRAEEEAAKLLRGDDAPKQSGGFFSGVWGGIKGAASGLWSAAKQVGGFFSGLGAGLVDTVSGLWQVVRHPIQTLEGLYYGVTHPKELWNAIKQPYVDDWQSGNYGKAIGRGAFEVLSLFAGGAGAVGKGGKVASVADKASDIARVADKASDVARAADKASDVARAADKAGDVARAADKISDANKLRFPPTFDDAAKAARVPEILSTAEKYKTAATLPQNVADDLGRLTTHGAGDRVVLGPWKGFDDAAYDSSYIAQAKSGGGRWFETPDGMYDALGRDSNKMWQVNESFLRQQLESGVPRIEYVGENMADVLKPANANRMSYKELSYLRDNAADFGYRFDPAAQAWIKDAGVGASDAIGRAGQVSTAGTLNDRAGDARRNAQ
jgi:WXG100 family type VII secretion target